MPADLTNMSNEKDNKILRILQYNKNTSDKLVNANCRFNGHLKVVIAQENLKCPEMRQLIHKRNFDRDFHNFENYPKCPHNIINTKSQI